MHFYTSPAYDLGRGLPFRQIHGFVLDRPTQTRRLLAERHGVADDAFRVPSTCDLKDFVGIHTPRALAALRTRAGLADAVEFPALRFLPSFVGRRAVLEPQLAAAGGTVDAILAAVDGQWSANLSGGFHHARPNVAAGFCLLNDVALGVHRMRAAGHRRRIAVVDLDAHQGDGNAAAFDDDDDVYTLSVHEGALFPNPKLQSDLDVALHSHMEDAAYLRHLDDALAMMLQAFRPEIVVYVAGVDPWAKDPLSSLQVSADGLRRRDERIARFTRDLGAALVVLPAGGYTPTSPALSAAGLAAIAQLAP